MSKSIDTMVVWIHLYLCKPHKEELTMSQGEAGERRGLWLVFGQVQVGVIRSLEASVVRNVLAQGLIAVDVLAVDFVVA